MRAVLESEMDALLSPKDPECDGSSGKALASLSLQTAPVRPESEDVED